MRPSLALPGSPTLAGAAILVSVVALLLIACTSDDPSSPGNVAPAGQSQPETDPDGDTEPDSDSDEAPDPGPDEAGDADEAPTTDDAEPPLPDDPLPEDGDPDRVDSKDPELDDAPEPPGDEPDEPESDPWETRRRDLLIELTDDVDIELLREFGQIVGERRGLPLLQEVPAFLIRRDDVDEYFAALYSDEDLQEAEFTEATYRLLRIIGDDVNFVDLSQDLFVGLVLGFYDEDVNSFIIISNDDHITRRDLDTISHEFVHALQDQHFRLDTLFDTTQDKTDADLALRFVLEGDARLSQSLFLDLLTRFGSELSETSDRLPGASSVPPLLRLIFNAPYLDGLNAVSQIVLNNGPNAIDIHLANPPASTEQLLHLDKLAAAERPIEVPDPDVAEALGSDWVLQGTDTIGEFVIRGILAETIGAGDGIRAAAGWGGDRLAIYHTEDAREVLVWEVAWDDFNETVEFARGIEEWLHAKVGGAAQWGADTSYSLNGGDGAAWAITAATRNGIWLGDTVGSYAVDGPVGATPLLLP